jgi:hypothetical protein
MMRVCLVLGGADCVWDDFEAAASLGEFSGVVGCNDIGVRWPGQMDAWVSLHAPKFRLWRAQRAARKLPPHKAIYGHTNGLTHFPPYGPDVGALDHAFPGEVHSGSSGLFALKAALIDLGFDRAVLCGIPMTPTGHIARPNPEWNGAHSHRKGWVEALPEIKDRARSMSGWTRELLGAPDQDWFKG